MASIHREERDASTDGERDEERSRQRGQRRLRSDGSLRLQHSTREQVVHVANGSLDWAEYKDGFSLRYDEQGGGSKAKNTVSLWQ